MLNDTTKIKLQSELHCHWIGPMPLGVFFKTFLDINQQTPVEMLERLPANHFDPLASTEQMCQSFINLVDDSGVAPNLQLFDTSKYGDDVDNTELTMLQDKPDIMAFHVESNKTTDPISYYSCDVLFTLNPNNSGVDPFHDLSEEATEDDLKTFLWGSTAERGHGRRSQITYYARAWMSRQHRAHCFVVWIGDPWARIVRFDRSGAIVTQRFSIRSQSHHLLEFLWRISCASPEMRGTDTTVSVVTDSEEVKLAKEKLADWNPNSSGDVMKFKIPDGSSVDNPRWREVLVWGPLADPQCVVGRATRGYPGWDLEDKKLVFVKDSWRVLDPDFSKETDILKTLNEAKVCNVPTLVYGDDLPGQTTRTQEFAGAQWNRGSQPKTFSTRVHIRLTSDLIGTPLTTFTSSKQFLQAWLDALLAHEEAYTKCGILHRDISLNNILFKVDGGGFLNDWDLARTLSEIKVGPRQPSRSGTWQFMSVYILRTPGTIHRLQDDLESFFWVLLYVTLRYLHTSIAHTAVADLMRTIFDATNVIDGSVTGGQNKDQVIRHRSYLNRDFSVQNNIPLSVLIDEILRILRSYHRFWLTFSDNIEALAEDKGICLESAGELHRSKAKDLKLSSHAAMILLAQKALSKDWPIDDCCPDRCKVSSKRTRTNHDMLDRAASSGSGPQKRHKV